MRKRITSLLLTLVMLLSLVPAMGVTANAAEWTTVNTYKELLDAVNYSKEYIKLGQNIDTTSYNEGIGLLERDQLTFKYTGYHCTLDLNGKTLALVSKDANMYSGIHVSLDSHLTIQDSSSEKTGKISGTFDNVLGGRDAKLIYVTDSTLTLEGGTLTVDSNPYKTNATVIDSERSFVTIKDGVKLSQPEFSDGGYASDFDGAGYALEAKTRKNGQGSVIIEGGEFDGCVKLTASQAENGSVQINGGTFKKDVQVLYDAEENNSDPAVTVNGGTFEGNVYLEPWSWRESLYMPYRLNGGTFKGTVNLHARRDGWNTGYIGTEDQPESNLNIAMGLDQCFGYSAVVAPDGTFTGPNAYTGVLEKFTEPHYEYYEMWLKGSESNPVRIIPNAWGMKSVTLDGNPIDYAKDWTGEWKRVGNNQDHTLGFEWYLSDDMKKAGYTYDAKYLLYRTNSSDEPTPIPVDTSKNTLELKIEKDALPGGYSYDFRLDLQKNGVDLLGSSTNQHIVMLVVYPAQVETKAITAVNLTVPELNARATVGSAVTLTASTPADSCTAGTTTWDIPTSGAVESTTYYATVTLTAKDGYAFGSGTAVNLTGDHVSQTASISGGGKTMTVRIGVAAKHVHSFGPWTEVPGTVYHERKCTSTGCIYSEQETHKWVVAEGSVIGTTFYKCSVCGADGGVITDSKIVDQLFIGITHPMDGDVPGEDPSRWAKICGPVSCMDNASIKSVQWYEADGSTLVTRFVAGKRYSVSITFKAHAGYQFVERERFNTKAPDFEVGTKTRSDDGTEMTVVYTLSEDNPIQKMLEVKVKLPSLNDKVGQSFPKGELVDAPAGITLSGGFLPEEDSTVQADKEYLYIGEVKSDDPLDSISVVIVNEGDAVAAGASGGLILAKYHTPDPNKIDIVALKIDAPAYGKAPAAAATGEDTRYTVDTPEWSPADSTFAARSYTVSIPVTAKDGYSFAANCLYTVNGYVATYADGKVSYTFPALTAPHEHDYTDQPWQYLDPGNHYQECKDNDGGLNIQAHTFDKWENVDGDTHKATCSKCKHEKTENHSWVFDHEDPPTFDAAGTRYYKCSATGCTATKTESVPALTAISAVNVTVTAPVKDAAPENATTTAGSPYSVANTDWEPTVSSTFAGGTEYTVKVSLEATGNNRFTDTTIFHINGKAAASATNNGEEAVITLTFDATEGAPAATEYTVTVNTDGNGTASADHATAAADTEIKLTATPNSGYHFKEWKVVKGGVTITDNKFTMPAAEVEIKAIFEKNSSTGGGGGGSSVTTYPITVKSAKNGDVTASHKSASKGTTVTLTVDPDKGYVLDTLTVLDGNNKDLKLTEKNGKYTFTMPASKVTVEAMFKASAPTGKNPFVDVPAGSYYEDAVVWAVEKGITSGTSAVTFDPNGNCTRAQAVTFLWRAAGSPAPKTKVMPFTDVPSGSYYYDAVLWAMEQGITKGTSDTMFSPDATCTRAQIVTFLWRANGSPAVSGNSAFTDVAADAYYAAAVTWAEKNDVTGGIGGGLFGSNNNCTRAQIVTFLYRAMK